MSNLSKISFRDKSSKVEEICSWLSDHGIKIDRSRINTYRKHINEMANYYEEGKVNDLLRLRSLHDLVNSSFEVAELIQIYEGLNDLKSKPFVDKLIEVNKGPIWLNEENASSSNRARNIAFELHIAARYSKAGYEIDLSDEADIIVKDHRYELFIECKRPLTDHSIHGNVKDALNQLKKRYCFSNKSSKIIRGLIALSISRVINRDMYLLPSNTTDDLDMNLQSINRSFIDQYKTKWSNPDDKRTIGALIYLGLPAIIKNQNMLTNCNQFDIYLNGYANNEDKSFLQTFTNKIKLRRD